MFVVEQRQKLDIDFHQFERLLFHVSQIIHISLEIKNPEGETMVCSPRNSHGVSCNKQGEEPGICLAHSFNLYRQIEKSGKTSVQKCDGDNDIIGMPLTCNNDLAGILFACIKTDKSNMDNRVIAFLEEIANRISREMHSQFEIDRFTQELSNKYEELNLIYDIGRNLGGIGNANKTIQVIVEQSKETLNSNMALASIPTKDIYESSYSSTNTSPIKMHDKTSIENLNRVIIEKFASSDIDSSYIVLNDTSNDIQLSQLFDVPLSMMVVPIKLKGSVTGFLCIIRLDTANPFQTGDVQLALSLAQLISMALTNTELHQNLKDFFISVIKTLVYSIDAKDAYTKGHSERVSTLAMMIAEAMGLSPEEKESLSWSSILHDIGKIGMLDQILTKQGKLTQEEFLHMKEHPEKGYRILLPIEQLNESLSGIRHHHERFDGTGYPLGLKGEKIPLNARIIAIADTFDAMTSDRSYRAKLSHEDALAEIVRVKGKQLDPEIVEVFIKLFESQPLHI
jgi:HD-GYP domain-containing protein (c-di-GMP phosphodiesterase class II)